MNILCPALIGYWNGKRLLSAYPGLRGHGQTSQTPSPGNAELEGALVWWVRKQPEWRLYVYMQPHPAINFLQIKLIWHALLSHPWMTVIKIQVYLQAQYCSNNKNNKEGGTSSRLRIFITGQFILWSLIMLQECDNCIVSFLKGEKGQRVLIFAWFIQLTNQSKNDQRELET